MLISLAGLNAMSSHTEVLFATTRLFNNLNESRLQLLDGRDVVGKDTHLAGFGWEIDLDAAQSVSSYHKLKFPSQAYTSCDL